MTRTAIQVNRTTSLSVQDCCMCGVVFAMPERFEDARRKDGIAFYCPNGHSLVFLGSENAKLREATEAAIQERNVARQKVKDVEAMLDVALRDKQAVLEAQRRLEKRANNGVCPHCHRTFRQVQRHIASKHGGTS